MGFLDDHHIADGSLITTAIQKFSVFFVGISVSMFMFISGFLYKPVEKHKVGSFVKKKSLRLLLPCFVFSSLIMLSGGFFDTKELFQGFWHLWFLLALFWCFMFSLLIDYSRKYAFVVLLLAFVMGGIQIKAPALIRDFVQWYYFFVLGAVLRAHPKISDIIKQYYLWIPLILFYVVITCTVPYHYRQPSVIYELAISAMVIAFFLIAEFSNRYMSENSFLKKAILSSGRYSMGIYIFHFWVLIYLLSTTSIRVFHIETLMQKIPLLIVPFLVIVNFSICYTLTALISRNKIGKFLLG
jgi:fucose 4-O-acetylase-like acetyltransferase